jgi:hypothetical protein
VSRNRETKWIATYTHHQPILERWLMLRVVGQLVDDMERERAMILTSDDIFWVGVGRDGGLFERARCSWRKKMSGWFEGMIEYCGPLLHSLLHAEHTC